MITDADRKIVEVRKNVRAAIESLSEVVVNRMSGYSDYTDGAREKMRSCLFELLNIEFKLPGNV